MNTPTVNSGNGSMQAGYARSGPVLSPGVWKKLSRLTVLAFVLLLGACGGSSSDDDTAPSSQIEPNAEELPPVSDVRSLSQRYVEVTFEQAASDKAAENIKNYNVVLSNGNTAPVVAATLAADRKTVLLEIAPASSDSQLVPNGTLEFDLVGVDDPATVFTGNGTIEPIIESVASLSDTVVEVLFNEPVSDDAGFVENYRIETASGETLPILAATMGASGDSVVLTTGPQDDVPYTVTLTGVSGRVSALPLLASASNLRFSGLSRNTSVATAPAVTSARSSGNTGVVIDFNKPMGISAINPANYAIGQESVNPEASGLAVVSAEFSGVDRSAVLLTTRSQNSLTYRVTVGNVRDTNGQSFSIANGTIDVIVANSTTFAGSGPDAGTLVDTDGDGLYDNEEQSGYTVIIEMANGDIVERQVTSDPDVADTDGDGVSDGAELQYGMNPRATDTDGDGLDDNLELNTVFSNPFAQDSDNDGLQDGFEHFDLKTSPLLADTDGDKLTDDEELFGLNRDPLVADLPRLSIDVGDIRLQIDERYSYTDENGNTVSQDSSTNTTLSSSEDTSFSESDSSMLEATGTVEAGFEAGNASAFGSPVTGFGAKAIGSVSVSGTTGKSNQIDKSSASQSQQAYENSLSKGQEFSTTSTVAREIVGARIDVDLSVENIGTVPFTISNLEITILEPSPTDARKFVPVATLVSNSELVTGTPLAVNLGPFSSKRGPFVFASREVFPNLVEALMRDPKGLIFRVANYDVTDELGRNFAYSNQVARDRTVGIVIDYGDASAAETYYVASSGTLDDQGFTSSADDVYLGGFSTNGNAKGLPLDYLLQARLGLKKHDSSLDVIVPGANGVLDSTLNGDDILQADTITAGPNRWLDSAAEGDDLVTNSGARDGLVAGLNKTADSIAQGDDIQLVPVDTTGLSVGTVVVDAGDNGVLDTPVLVDDRPEFVSGYETGRTCNAFSINAGTFCRIDSQCGDLPGATGSNAASCTGPERLTRVNGLRSGDFNRDWFVLTTDQVAAAADFGSITVDPGENITLAFLQDLDRDGLFGRDEFLAGTIDSAEDNLDNSTFGVDETLITCVAPTASGCDGLADSKDSDQDGLGDYAEVRIGWRVSSGGGQLRQVYSNPSVRDSDGDGLLDPEEQDVSGYCIENDLRTDGLCAFVGVLNSASQGDAISIIAGNNITADSIAGDTNGDGLVDGNDAESDDVQLVAQGENAGGVAINVISAGPNNIVETAILGDDFYISPQFVPPATDPSQRDTDLDLVSDFDELKGFDVGLAIIDGGDRQSDTTRSGDDVQKVPAGNPTLEAGIIMLPGPNGVLDSALGGDDLRRPALTVQTDPLRRDTDNDNNTDGLEITLGSNPTVKDDDVFKDDDQDGLSNAEETELGWRVTVNVGFGSYVVFPSPSLADTDSDGLPDFIERDLRTDPNKPDTDGDGISDYDEVDDFDRFARLMALYPNVVINGAGSAKYGTSPTMGDSDSDLLSDYEELVTGFSMTLPGDSSPRTVFTNPAKNDTDNDGVSDWLEVGNGSVTTDPTDNDTDDDGRTDGQELAVGSDPLTPDIAIRFAFESVTTSKAPGDGANNLAEMTWWFTTKGPEDTLPQLLTSPQPIYTDPDYTVVEGGVTYVGALFDQAANDGDTDLPQGTDIPDEQEQCFMYPMNPGNTTRINLVNSSREVVLQPGESMRLSGIMGEIDRKSSDCGNAPYYIPSQLHDGAGCVVTVEKLFTYEELVTNDGQQLLTLTDENSSGCSMEFQYSVSPK